MTAPMDDTRPDHDDRPPGLLSSLGRLVSTALDVVETRLELLSNDLAIANTDLTKLVIVGATVVLCVQLGALLGVIFIILVVPESARALVVGVSALVVFAGSIGGALWLRNWLRKRPPFFEATIGELRKDRDRLRGRR
jgi:uncharacterized membrane protein YqjE